MRESKLTFSFRNVYFDKQNFTEPTQKYLDGQFFWDIMPGFRKKNDIYIGKNEAELQDEVIQLGTGKSMDFYQLSRSRDQIELMGTDEQFASIYIRFDPYTDQYERRVFSLSDLLGQVGGIYEVMLITGMILVGIFQERLLISSILNKIYQIDKTRDAEIMRQKKELKNKKKNKTHPMKNLNSGKSITGMLPLLHFLENFLLEHRKEYEKSADQENIHTKRDKFMNEVKANMLKRSKFNYGYREIFAFIFCCGWIRPKKNMRKNLRLRKQVHFLPSVSKFLNFLKLI